MLFRSEKAIKKTALGAEGSVPWKRSRSLPRTIASLKRQGYSVLALEQHPDSVEYDSFRPSGKVALIVGNEVSGIGEDILRRADTVLEIPMHGAKNSLNVSVAAGIALYQITGTMKKVR